jgi:hypothetical protein
MSCEDGVPVTAMSLSWKLGATFVALAGKLERDPSASTPPVAYSFSRRASTKIEFTIEPPRRT